MRDQDKHRRRLKKICKKQVKQRVNDFESLKHHMSTRVQQFFVIVCDIVGYYGQVDIDHDKKEIRMFVKKYDISGNKEITRRLVDEMIESGQKNNIGSLSGGERSISTVRVMNNTRGRKIQGFRLGTFFVFWRQKSLNVQF